LESLFLRKKRILMTLCRERQKRSFPGNGLSFQFQQDVIDFRKGGNFNFFSS
jgi:hypothetical protein